MGGALKVCPRLSERGARTQSVCAGVATWSLPYLAHPRSKLPELLFRSDFLPPTIGKVYTLTALAHVTVDKSYTITMLVNESVGKFYTW